MPTVEPALSWIKPRSPERFSNEKAEAAFCCRATVPVATPGHRDGRPTNGRLTQRGSALGRIAACLGFAVAAMTAAIPGHAHPVAQGAMEFHFEPGRLVVQARVAPEEVLVALAFDTGPGSAVPPPVPGSSTAAWDAHGSYLLGHVRVFVDGQPLAGRFAGVQPPADAGAEARAVYTLEYPLANPAPRSLRVEEDVLKEFTYAPGNPWTASYVVRVDPPGGAAPVAGLLLAREQPLDFALPAASALTAGPVSVSHAQIVHEYIIHGLWHILTGYDHMLFMGALVLAARTLWDLVKVVSAFTLAHTLTLTLSVLDVFRLPERVVEPMIAASIVFVAVQNIVFPARAQGWTRLAAAFGFGLFHGLGFAGGLLEAMNGLPGLAIGTAIAAFSVGVELGHQAVVLPVFGGLKLAERFAGEPSRQRRLRVWAERAGSAAISVAGAFYLVVALRG